VRRTFFQIAFWGSVFQHCPLDNISVQRKKVCCSSSATGWPKFIKIYFIYLFNLFLKIGCIYRSKVNTVTIKFWQQHFKDLKALYPGGIWTRILLFCRQTRWPIRHAARVCFVIILLGLIQLHLWCLLKKYLGVTSLK
jgi:hypothetical protein